MSKHYELSSHANARMQQRGVIQRSLEFVLENADRTEFIGSGCQEQWVSRQRLRKLRRCGADARLVERATGVAIVVSAEGTIVTVYHKIARGRHKKNKQHSCQKRIH